jgi:hypothetical protein
MPSAVVTAEHLKVDVATMTVIGIHPTTRCCGNLIVPIICGLTHQTTNSRVPLCKLEQIRRV